MQRAADDRGRLRTAALTAGALVAFAGNSWLCRAALRTRSIDPASFTAVRIASGALTLVLLSYLLAPRPRALRLAGSWRSAGALVAYAIAFSFAYLDLGAGVGALLLFGAVQVTMFCGAFLTGHRPAGVEAVGLVLAFAGLVWLTLPGASAPAPLAAVGMAAAGCAWGIYSLRGRRETAAPLAVTAGNFVRGAPLALALLAASATAGAFGDGPGASRLHGSPMGVGLALLSGALTSGVGYAIWYAALPGLRPAQAGLVQLAVPVLTALGGVLFLAEQLSSRLLVAAVLVLSGIALAVAGTSARARTNGVRS